MTGLRIRQQPRFKFVVAALALFFVVSPYFSVFAQAAWQGTVAASVRRHYSQWPATETASFHLRYSEADSELAEWLGAEADAAAASVAAILPHTGGDRKPWLILVPDQETLRQAFGWSDATGALGVYVADTIKILSPAAWDWHAPKERLEVFTSQGPLVHEYTHYVLDLRTNGNYTRWFSEGLSQLMEYNILVYEWLEEQSALTGSVYTLEELDRSFDALPNEARVYRQSLSMITFLEAQGGMDSLNQMIDRLETGRSFYASLEEVYGMDRETFFAAWQAWYPEDGRWFLTR
jgi:hypothetical protein